MIDLIGLNIWPIVLNNIIIIQKMKIMSSGPITMANRWRKKWKQWQVLFSWAPKSLQMMTAVMKLNDCLLPGRKPVTNLDSILKSRDITLSTKVHIVKAVVFPVVMHGCDSWTIKKAEGRRIDAFDCGVGEDSWESFGQQGGQTS